MQKAGLAIHILVYITIGHIIIDYGYAGTSSTAVDGLHISSFYSKGGSIYAGTWGYGLYCSDDMGKTWKRFNNGLTNLFIYSIHINNNSFLVGTDGGGIFKYNNREKQWNALSNGTIGNTIFAVLETRGVILASSWSHGLHRSENSGKTWEKVSEGLTDSVIYSLCHSSKYLYAGGAKNGVYRSRDRGKSWDIIGLKKKTITCLKSVKNDIWCGTWESGLYYFNETDSIWHRSYFSSVENIDALAYSQKSNVVYCANKNDGVFKSADYGSSWYSIGLTQYKAFSLFVLNNVLFAGTWGSGIFVYKENSEWNKAEDSYASSNNTIKSDSLNDNVKNITTTTKAPFVNAVEGKIDTQYTKNTNLVEEKVVFINSIFQKKYDIHVHEQQDSKIIIHVYDYSGQQVYTRTETIKNMEKRTISLDLSGFYKGVYMISIQSEVKEKPVKRIYAH